MIACEHCGTYTRAPVIVTDALRGSTLVASWNFCSIPCEQAWWALLNEPSAA